jgi:hypothetical protein
MRDKKAMFFGEPKDFGQCGEEKGGCKCDSL